MECMAFRDSFSWLSGNVFAHSVKAELIAVGYFKSNTNAELAGRCIDNPSFIASFG